MLSLRNTLWIYGYNRLNVKEWKTVCHSSTNRKCCGEYIKVDRRTRNISRDKEDGYFIIKRKRCHQEDIVILNVCTCINRDSKYMKQKLTE